MIKGAAQSGRTRVSLVGPACAVIGILGFSFKAILIKLAYSWAPIDPITLLTLRMIYSVPFFALMAWWATRSPEAKPMRRHDWLAILWLGFIGYYLASLLDFIGLQYITASLERLVLFLNPTMVVLLSMALFRQRIGGRTWLALVLSYAGILLVVEHDLRFVGDIQGFWLGAALVFAAAFCYALYLVGAGPVIARLGSLRFISWAMLTSAMFVIAQFLLTRPLAALGAPASIQFLSLVMALFSTVLPTFLVAEAIKRVGANRTSIIGSLGPLFTIWLGWWMLGEAVHWIQLAGAALVLGGVTLVTMKPTPA
ncbi:MAG TPA: DMT family transporter [Casimicrobiaceae bacterium]|nr:DMT family transporter [Casimicrobiaceae bacterium]